MFYSYIERGLSIYTVRRRFTKSQNITEIIFVSYIYIANENNLSYILALSESSTDCIYRQASFYVAVKHVLYLTKQCIIYLKFSHK